MGNQNTFWKNQPSSLTSKSWLSFPVLTNRTV